MKDRDDLWRRRGWTVLELLVVIGLIAGLAALLLTAVGRARESLHGMTCRENLRQWGLATLLYAQEHEGYLPAEGAPNGRSKRQAWYVLLPEVLGLPVYHQQPWRTNAAAPVGRSVWICPANPARSLGENLFHYCLNGWTDGRGKHDMPVQLASFDRPGDMIWMFDNGGRAAVAQQNNVHSNLHSGGAHFLFLDGQVRHEPAHRYWDEARGRGLTGQAGLVWKAGYSRRR